MLLILRQKLASQTVRLQEVNILLHKMELMAKKCVENVTTLVFQVSATMNRPINVKLVMQVNSDNLIPEEGHLDANV